MTLHPLWGHEEIRRVLARTRTSGTFPAALLLHGAAGVGKQRLALWAAQLLLCGRPGGEPCGDCRSCRLALRLEHPDLHWHFPLERPRKVAGDRLGDALEEARWSALEDARSEPIRFVELAEPNGIYLAAMLSLRRRAHSRPAMGSEQIFIIGNAEALVSQESSPEAANALLKLLEEPPADTRFILTSSEPGRLLPTIRSRAVPLHVGGLPASEVRRFLLEAADADPAEAERATRLGGGSIGRALGFLPGVDNKGQAVPGPLEVHRRRALELLLAALSPRRGDGFGLALSLPAFGARGQTRLLDFLDAAIRDLATVAAGEPDRAADPDAAHALARAVAGRAVDPADVPRCMAAVEDARERARGNVNPQLLVAGLIESLRRTLLGREPAGARR